MSTDKLPDGWTRVKFADIAASITERVDDPSAAGVDRYVGLEHLDPESTGIRRWGSPSDVESTKLRFYPGDVIYGRRRAYQRKLGVADFDGICSAHALVLRAKPAVCLPEFLPYFLQSDAFHQRALDISVGSLSPTINWKTLAVQEFALPPIDEQRRIVDLLMVSQLVVERHSVLSESLVSVGKSIIGGASRFSKTARLGEIAELTIGKTPPRDNPVYWDADSKLPFCTIADLTEPIISETRESISSRAVDEGKAKLFPAGTLMMSFKLTIGKIAFAGVDLWPNEAIVGIDPHGGDEMRKYLSWVLQVIDLSKTSDRAVKGNTLNLRKIREIEVPLVGDDTLPGLLLQLSALESMIERSKSAVTNSREMHKALQSLLIGVRDV